MTDEQLAYYDALVAGEHSIAHLAPLDVRMLTGEVRRVREENARLVEAAVEMLNAVAGAEFTGTDGELDRLDTADDKLRAAVEGSK